MGRACRIVCDGLIMGLRIHLSASRIGDKMRVKKAKREFYERHRQAHIKHAEALNHEAESLERELTRGIEAGVLNENDPGMDIVRARITGLKAQAIAEVNGECMENHL